MGGRDIPLPFMTRKMLAFDPQASFGLRVTLTGIDTNVVNVIGYTREGIFKFRATHSGDGTAESTNFNIPDIPIMVSVFCLSDAMDRGEMWAEMWLTINGERVFRFGSGYISAQTAISWPAQINETEHPGRGLITRVAGANPAVGAECSDTVPTNERWRVLCYSVQLTSVNSGSARNVHLVTNMVGTGLNQHHYGAITQAINVINKWYFVPNGGFNPALDGTDIIVPIPHELWLNETGTLGTETTNLVATDDFGSPTILVEKFMVA